MKEKMFTWRVFVPISKTLPVFHLDSGWKNSGEEWRPGVLAHHEVCQVFRRWSVRLYGAEQHWRGWERGLSGSALWVLMRRCLLHKNDFAKLSHPFFSLPSGISVTLVNLLPFLSVHGFSKSFHQTRQKYSVKLRHTHGRGTPSTSRAMLRHILPMCPLCGWGTARPCPTPTRPTSRSSGLRPSATCRYFSYHAKAFCPEVKHCHVSLPTRAIKFFKRTDLKWGGVSCRPLCGK